MELNEYIAILWRRKWVILITTIVTILITAVGVLFLPVTYEASTTLRIAPAGISYTDFTYANQLKNTFSRIATSDLVRNEVAQVVGLNEPADIRMEILGASELIRLTVEHTDPRLAQISANTAAEILTDLHGELYVNAEVTAREVLNEQLAQAERELNEARIEYERATTQSPDDLSLIQEATNELELKRQIYSTLMERNSEAQIRETLMANAFSVFEPADLPENPSGLPKVLYVALGAMVGLTAGTGLAFLFENLDTAMHTAEQIKAVTQLPILGSIPTAPKQQPIIFSNGRSPQEESFRRLRTNLFALDASTPLRTLLVASAEPQEGKTTIVAKLACAIAESGRQVIAVDCDLHRPTLHTILGLTNGLGVSSVLQKKATLDAALQTTDIPGLQLLCSGPATPRLGELLGSPAMTDLVENLRQRFDIVLLDTPAIQAVVDASILAPLTDGVLLVVERARTQERSVRNACQQLANVDATLIGVVVNRDEQASSYGYYADYQRLQKPLNADEDSLTRIRGIGPGYEKALRALGITTHARLGEQDAEKLAVSMDKYVTPTRIQKERLIEQAQNLSQHKGNNESPDPEIESPYVELS